MTKTWVRIVTTALTIGVMVMIFCFSMETAEESDATSGEIAAWVADRVRPEWRSYPPEEKKAYYDSVQYVIRKCAHFSEFALLGISLRLCLESWLGRRKWLSVCAWAGSALYAVLDESHQTLVSGRSGQWKDVGIDSAGALTGVLLTVLVLYLVRKRKTKSA